MAVNYVRGLRGAITVKENTREAISTATRDLLQAMVAANHLAVEAIASVIFSVTPDLDAEFPACAARALGWQHVALLDTKEIAVPGALPRCIRVLMHINTTCKQEEMVHIYLGDAVRLRPDRSRAGLRHPFGINSEAGPDISQNPGRKDGPEEVR